MNYLYITASFYTMLLLLVTVGQNVQAMPLLNTDDADIVDPQHCQIELGQLLYDGQHHDANITPACNVMGFELGIPLSSDDRLTGYAVQVKRQLFSFERLPVAVAASAQWQPKQLHHAQGWQFNLPVSIYASETLQFDANVGLNHEANENETTWGVAGTYDFNPIHQLSIELFKNQAGRPRSQAVYHYNVVPDNLSLYAAVGHPMQSNENPWVGLGLSWVMAMR